MKKIILITTLSLLFTMTAWGEMLDCTDALVEQGVCKSAENKLLYYQGSQEVMAEVLEALSTGQKYLAEFECTDAAVAASLCTADELGIVVANPVSQAEFADRVMMNVVKTLVVIYRKGVAGEAASIAAQEAVNTEVEIE